MDGGEGLVKCLAVAVESVYPTNELTWIRKKFLSNVLLRPWKQLYPTHELTLIREKFLSKVLLRP